MKHRTHPLLAIIRELLEEKADPVRAEKMRAYMKSEMPFYGVSHKIQASLFRQAIRENPVQSFEEYVTVIEDLWNGNYREERYSALFIANRYPAFQIMEALPLYRTMIETGAWWDMVDSIAPNLVGKGLLKNFPKVMKPILYRWIEEDDLWIRRAAILSQLRFKLETDEKMLYDFCSQCLEEKIFWIRKSIGWALREYSKVNPGSVKLFVKKNRSRMSGLTLREASKYLT